MDEIMKKLQAPFPADEIEWRVSRAMKTKKGPKATVLAYVTNRAIMNRLDELFGFDGWRNEYKEWRDKGILCGLSVKIDGEWVTKYDGAEETQFEATKGGFSGAMKRAAVQFGIGRYLYNLDETWVDIKDRGQNYIKTEVKVGNQKEWITGYWDTPTLPNWALPQSNHPATQEQVGTIKTKALQFAKMRGKTDKDVLEKLSIKNLTKLNTDQAETAIAQLEKWIKKAEEEAA